MWQAGERRPTHRQQPPKVRAWRTRADPFEAVWPQAREWLEQEPDITGKALFDRLRGKYPGEFAPGQLRTLQRRVREWRQAMARQLIGIADPVQDQWYAVAQSSIPLPQSPTPPPGGEMRAP